ncbi:MAG: 4Fe-4S dicluster domain-containing protein [Deltaproteobacteria bacterium]|nr:4Fe-4S dicluster domain-containing protein [Deltaproteobacteria bacterium]MBW2153847.1 4Fe-4S dicluster domain-containing protein [Deltaproteobacteria bacterium]
MILAEKKEFSGINTRRRQSLVANPHACTGCRTCEAICSLIKTGAIAPDMARIGIDRRPFKGEFVQRICLQCSIPYCLNACPVGAIRISNKIGTVLIDKHTCDGCGLCKAACPYGVIVIDTETEKAYKCDLCNGKPQCVKSCPMNALGIAVFGNEVPP